MNTYIVTVYIVCETQEQAETVAAKRLAYDEDYGFEYGIDYEPVEWVS